MERIQPVGARLLVHPTTRTQHTTEGGIEVPLSDLQEGVVLEVSPDLNGLFSVDDTILYGSGCGQSQYYKGKLCLWLNANIDVWGIIQQND